MKSAFSGFAELQDGDGVKELPKPPTFEQVKEMVKDMYLEDGNVLKATIYMIPRLWRRDFGLMVREALHDALDELGYFDVQVVADFQEIDMYETQERYHGRVQLSRDIIEKEADIINRTHDVLGSD